MKKYQKKRREAAAAKRRQRNRREYLIFPNRITSFDELCEKYPDVHFITHFRFTKRQIPYLLDVIGIEEDDTINIYGYVNNSKVEFTKQGVGARRRVICSNYLHAVYNVVAFDTSSYEIMDVLRHSAGKINKRVAFCMMLARLAHPIKLRPHLEEMFGSTLYIQILRSK